MVYTDLLQSVVLTASAGIGALVALAGLRTWRQQLKGGAEYALARRLLLAVYHVRDGLAFLRSRLILGSDIAAAAEAVGMDPSNLDPGDSQALARVRAHRRRHLATSLSALRAEELEAEVVWGPPVRDATAALWACIDKLDRALAEYETDYAHQDVPREPEDRKRYVALRTVMHGSGDDGDAFGRETRVAVEAIEAFLRPYLRL